jgi:hypothetical protein
MSEKFLSDGKTPRCQVSLIHRSRNSYSSQCVLRKDHQDNDSDHEDRHGCKAKVLVTQATLREVRGLAEYDREQAEPENRWRRAQEALAAARAEEIAARHAYYNSVRENAR